ncbi:MAG: ABC transporter permease subunit [Candidatus Cellulosilyticum pullistercoris]|uniref:ABC transporter permease subunit n=1 Tax=Candidatus Cellulosilyticum pullistercoris TaxID=2838521 RepID=A0A9E2KE71_9FIRM|nr:ABC transporter permease subunit [Candidatus Cellulosilyticum pullistercoris]
MVLTNHKTKRKDVIKKKIITYWDLYVLMLPGLLYFIIFKYLPMYGAQIAFKNYMPSLGIWGSPWVGFDHFQRFFSSPNFGNIMWNTVSLSLFNILFGFPAPIILALIINEIKWKPFKKAVQTITYAPHFISTVVLVGLLQMILSPSSGIINNILQVFNIQPIYFMAEEGWFKPIYILSGIWKSAGWGSIIYLAAISGIDTEMYESAKIDGASRWKQLIYITLPNIMPTAMIMLILDIGKVMSIGFEKVFLMQNSMNIGVSEIISTYVYNVGILDVQFSYSTAIGLFNSIINLIMLILANWVSKKVTQVGLW